MIPSPPSLPDQPVLYGLSQADVAQRRAAGQNNSFEPDSSRSYTAILKDNVFTFINMVFFAITLLLVLLGRSTDAMLVGATILANIVINLIQEVRAKRTLDKIALLTRPRAIVIREGQEQSIDPADIVQGDVLLLNPGDQVLVDGDVLQANGFDVDESLLTGESDLVAKHIGDMLYSGSFCMHGSAYYRAQKVGKDSFAAQLAAGAKAHRQVLTPLQREVNLVIRILLLLAVLMLMLVTTYALLEGLALADVIQIAAVIVGLIPSGLYVTITLAYAMGALSIAKQDTLIQQSNAIESLSNVDVLCLDKTGTLTTNHMQLVDMLAVQGSEASLRRILGDYAASCSSSNKTLEAIAEACPGVAREVAAECSFSSRSKWSALVFANHRNTASHTTTSRTTAPGVYLLGASEMLGLQLSPHEVAYIEQASAQGLRVLALAHHPDPQAVQGYSDPERKDRLEARIVQTPQLLALLAISDTLRPEVSETLAGFREAGIAVKIISGDNPQTVAALARQAGLSLEDNKQVVSGLDLPTDPQQLAAIAERATVFGRITPQQKEALVAALRQRGHYVAMIGDGVNDVLSFKRANLAIAMESGAQATRSVADIVLLNNAFTALPKAFAEGQRIRNGMQDIMKLFLTRIFAVAGLIFAIALVTAEFPLFIKQNSVLTVLTVSIPTTFLVLWAKPGAPPKRSMMRSILRFLLPATLSLSLIALFVYILAIYAGYISALSPTIVDVMIDPSLDDATIEAMFSNVLTPELEQHVRNTSQSALVTIMVFCGLLLIPLLKPPTPAWVASEALSGDKRPSLVALLMLVCYALLMAIPEARRFFELSPLPLTGYLVLGLVAILWSALLRLMWRRKWLEHFLDVEL